MDTVEPLNWLILDLLVPFGVVLGWLIWYDHGLRRARRAARRAQEFEQNSP